MALIQDTATHHAIQFYDDENDLFHTTAQFLSAGLLAGHPALVITTPEHRDAILNRLRLRGIDVDAAQDSFSLVVLDARETLARFLVDGIPDRDEFEASVGALLADLLRLHESAVLSAYDEMVDVLWRDRRCAAAAQLETRWNQLAIRHRVALRCCHALGHCFQETGQDEAEGFVRLPSHLGRAGSRRTLLDERESARTADADRVAAHRRRLKD